MTSRGILFLCALVISSTSAFSQSILTEDRAIQMRLHQEGLLTGKPDGKVGPATRSAMSAYAEANGIENNKNAIISKMVEHPLQNPIDITDRLKDAVTESVKNQLNDPYSAQISVDYAYPDGAGRVGVCGTVNAKNLYGAYVGKKAFHSTVTILPVIPPSATTIIDDNDATLMCSLGTSLSHLLGIE